MSASSSAPLALALRLTLILIDGSIGNGSLLAGTHRAAANDIMVMLGGEALIPVVSLDEVEISDDLQAALDDCDYEMIDQIWDRKKMTNIIQRAISKHGAKSCV